MRSIMFGVVALTCVALPANLARGATYEATTSLDSGVDMDNSSPVSANASSTGSEGSASANASINGLKAVSAVSGSGSGYTTGSSASVSVDDLILTSSSSTADTALNLVLNGSLAAQTQDGTGSVSDVTITVNIGTTDNQNSASGYTELDSNGSSAPYTNPGDGFAIPPTSTQANSVTFTDAAVSIPFYGLPANTPLSFEVTLGTRSEYSDVYDNGIPASSSASFGDTLQFDPTNVFSNVDDDPAFTANAPDAGIVDNMALPEPTALAAAAVGVALSITRRRRLAV